jgi:hypothetical protein
MSSRTTNLTTNQLLEYDILEEQFLDKSCKVEDIPLPKKQLDGFEFEIREIMKSGCNRQIAEYSLLTYDIVNSLKELKNNYREVKSKIRNCLDQDVEAYLNNLKNPNENDKHNDNKEIIEKDKNNSYKVYEEEADEIIEEKFDIIENETKLLTEKDSIKKYIMSRYKYYSDGAYKDDEFFDYKKAYTDKRDAILEAALRVVKKVVNDEIKYDTFYKEYKSMQ